MATIHKTIPFINGAYIDINSETNKNPKLYTGTNSALEQAEYSFESDGQIWVRTRTRANAADNWGAWSSWVHANNKPPIATEQVTGTIVRTPGKYAQLTAPTKSGYTFSHWVTAYTTGWIGSLYPDQPTSATSSFWLVALVGSASTSKGSFGAVAVYYKV